MEANSSFSASAYIAQAHAPPACKICSKPTTLHCGACSKFIHPAMRAAYCSKACQKVDWANHKQICHERAFYCGVRGLTFGGPSHEQHAAVMNTVEALAQSLRICGAFATIMLFYLRDVEPSARPPFLSYAPLLGARIKDNVIDTMVDVSLKYRNGKNYMADYETRVPQSDRDKVGTSNAFEIPFDHRPFHRHPSPDATQDAGTSESNDDTGAGAEDKPVEAEDGEDNEGWMDLWAQDYKQLSFHDYVENFGDDKPKSKPFKTFGDGIEYASINENGKEMVAAGAFSGKLLSEDVMAFIHA